MKRSSTVVFEPSAKSMEFRYKRRNQSKYVPKKLVDYSVHEDSDDEVEFRKTDPVAELQAQLNALIHPITSKLHTANDEASQKAVQCKLLMDQASLKLQAEEAEEKDRNNRLLKKVSDALDSEHRYGVTHKQHKRRKVEMSVVLEKILSRKCRLLKGKMSSASSTETESALRKKMLQVLLKKHNRR